LVDIVKHKIRKQLLFNGKRKVKGWNYIYLYKNLLKPNLL